MTVDLGLLILTAASIGFVHTLLGPDHYVPFVAMGAARNWTLRRTLWITGLCGLGHVAGSVILGAIGIAIGLSVEHMAWFEGLRGDWAAWALTAFGLAYLAWGLKHAARARPHTHEHVHGGGLLHRHRHTHEGPHLHPHLATESGAVLRPPPAAYALARHPDAPEAEVRYRAVETGSAPARTAARITPWALFVVFILGPCEPLIPVLMVPASQHSVWGTAAVVLAFGAATLATMLAVVYLGIRGVERLPLAAAERYAHALAGAALSLCGLGILFLGL